MKVWIVHDSKHGNGKRIAEIFGNSFIDDEVKISHIKDIRPEIVVQDAPDVLIVGCAIRIFRLSGSRKWLEKLQKYLEKTNQQINYGICFITHARNFNKISKHTEKFYQLLKEGKGISQVYPNYLTCQVEEIEGPFKLGVVEHAKNFSKSFQKWVINRGVFG